ncbi:MAG: GntR family transcriptional regulator, partial [Gammaproteobacteria bacterium]|nr:GntR family transcriptional regulator [Gammaproteobacteria bacterium]
MASASRSRRIRPLPRRDAGLARRQVDKGVARYYRLYELLSAALQDGTIAPESALPSEPALCARYGISRTT